MDTNLITSIQQIDMQKMGDPNSGNEMAKMMRETMELISKDSKEEIKSFIEELDKAEKKDVVNKITQIEPSDMSTEELTSTIMDLLKPTQGLSKPSNSTSTFSVYA